MTGVYVESRPFPGHVPAPAPDLTKTAAGALAAARQMLTGTRFLDCPPGCRCSVWCRDEWDYADHAIGECVAGDGPCRSIDPEGRVRHPGCEVPDA